MSEGAGGGAGAGVRVPPRARFAWVWAAIWLLYLVPVASDGWAARDGLALGALAVFAGLFIAAFVALPCLVRWGSARSAHAGAALIIATSALAVLIIVRLGPLQVGIFSFVGVVGMFLLPRRWGVGLVAGLTVGSLLGQVLIPGWELNLAVQFEIGVSGFAVFGVVQVISRNRALDRARQEIARLAVEEERNRFARDLHDILGHSLTVVTVKAELAGRLVHLDPDRAAAEIASIESLARGALADVRAAVANYREVSLAGELANARTALSAAGIDAELPSAVDDVPPERRELFGWVVREGVTNVIRHSGASRCEVTVTPRAVRVADDGGGGPEATPNLAEDLVPGRGHGLTGLRERAAQQGASLRVERPTSGGFALSVTL